MTEGTQAAGYGIGLAVGALPIPGARPAAALILGGTFVWDFFD